ncbi:MAG: hypothetical protein U5N86_13800 [Planctomycetota bacterium]|nr:hypothetical protein [Planctomycetota bacterium]
METLHDGDIIKVGEFELTFKNPAQEPSAAVPVPVDTAEAAAMAGVPSIPKKRKLDPKVLAAKRERLQKTLADKDSAGNIVKWSFAAVAIIAILVGVALAVLSMTKGDDGPGYDQAAAYEAMLEVRKLKDAGEFEEAFKKAKKYYRVYRGTKEGKDIKRASEYCRKKLDTPDVDWKQKYAKSTAEFEAIVDRLTQVKQDPMALHELYMDYKAWKSRYANLDSVARRGSQKIPDFKSHIRRAIYDAFGLVQIRASMSARDSHYGEAITKLRFFKSRYKDIVTRYMPEKWPEYTKELNAQIDGYIADAKEEFEYNWELAEFYIKENMIDEAVKCLSLIIDNFGIPEYVDLAKKKMASIAGRKGVPNVTGPEPGEEEAKVKVLDRFTDEGSDNLIRRYLFAKAVKYLEDMLKATPDDNLKARIQGRIDEVQPMADHMKWFLNTFGNGDKVDLGKGLTGKVDHVDESALYLVTAGGKMTFKWETFKPRELYEMTVERRSASKFNAELYLGAAAYCLEFALRREALSNMSRAYEKKAELKEKLDLLYARYSGKELPEDGFIVHKGRWLTKQEFEYAKLEEAVDAAVAKLDSNDEAVREKAIDKLYELAKENENLVVSRLTMKLSELIENIKKSKVLKTLESVQSLRDKLNEMRKEALRIIFDKKIYPDENHGAVGQPIVDEAVAKVREIYKTPIKGVLEAEPSLKLLVMKAKAIHRCLLDLGVDMDDSLLNVDTLLEALNEKININVGLKANELRIYQLSMKVKEYNHLLKIPGVTTENEKSCVRATNEYRLMMGMHYLRMRPHDNRGRTHTLLQHAHEGVLRSPGHVSPAPRLSSVWRRPVTARPAVRTSPGHVARY